MVTLKRKVRTPAGVSVSETLTAPPEDPAASKLPTSASAPLGAPSDAATHALGERDRLAQDLHAATWRLDVVASREGVSTRALLARLQRLELRPSASVLQQRYAELGSWERVAKHVGVSRTTLGEWLRERDA